jgi:hypothetical protein
VKNNPCSSSFADSGSGEALARDAPRFLFVVVVARATVAFAALGFGAVRLGSSSDLRGLAVCLERSRRVVVEATTSSSPDAGCDAAALRAARVVRAGAGSAVVAAAVRRVLTMLLNEICGFQSMVGAMVWVRDKGRSDELLFAFALARGTHQSFALPMRSHDEVT